MIMKKMMLTLMFVLCPVTSYGHELMFGLPHSHGNEEQRAAQQRTQSAERWQKAVSKYLITNDPRYLKGYTDGVKPRVQHLPPRQPPQTYYRDRSGRRQEIPNNILKDMMDPYSYGPSSGR